MAAQGCTGTQRERDLHAHKVTGPTPLTGCGGGAGWGGGRGGQSEIRRGEIVELELEVCTGWKPAIVVAAIFNLPSANGVKT